MLILLAFLALNKADGKTNFNNRQKNIALPIEGCLH